MHCWERVAVNRACCHGRRLAVVSASSSASPALQVDWGGAFSSRTDRPMTIPSVLANSFSASQAGIEIPIITNRWLVGFFFLVHFIFGSFTMGTLVFGPTYEWIRARRKEPPSEALAR